MGENLVDGAGLSVGPVYDVVVVEGSVFDSESGSDY